MGVDLEAQTGLRAKHLASMFLQNLIRVEPLDRRMFSAMTNVCSIPEYRTIINFDARSDSKVIPVNML